MNPASPWIAYYEVMPGGQYRMLESNLDALETAHPDRVIFADLAGHSERAVLLDWPFRVAEKCVGIAAFHLRRITIAELPGWKQAISFLEEKPGTVSLRDSNLMGAKLDTGVAAGLHGVELTLNARGETFK